MVDDVIDVIANAQQFKVRITKRGTKRLTLMHNGHEAVLELCVPGDDTTAWLLTGFNQADNSDVVFDLSALDGTVFFDRP